MEKLNPLFNISRIIAKGKLGELDNHEEKLLQKWLQENAKNRNIYNKLKENQNIINEIKELDDFDSKSAFKKVKIIINSERRTRIIPFIPNTLKYAASIIIVIAGIYLTYNYLNKPLTDQVSENQIEPGTQKAILTTADNQKIELGKTNKKTIFRQKRATIVDTSSTLTYHIDDTDEKTEKEEIITEYNQLETPRGGEYTLILSDGSKVILNSETRLKFPVTFSDDQREVELEGEAFFEVAKSENKPFLVKINGMKVKVYGTSFNISGYRNDDFIQTTLVEGKIGLEISNEDKVIEYKLVPGQQANYEKNTSSVEMKKVDTDLYTAWTKGMFVFENEPLRNILKKLGRWYDFDVEYTDEKFKNEPFTGDLKRYENASKILDMISIASDIEFKVSEKKILVYGK